MPQANGGARREPSRHRYALRLLVVEALAIERFSTYDGRTTIWCLSAHGVPVWFDKARLRPGSWKMQIERAIARSRYFLICVSENTLRKTGDNPGFQDRELQVAFTIALAQPEASFTIVPLRLENCGHGDARLSAYQQYDLFPSIDEGIGRLVAALESR
jgi:hypothetical protein